MSKEWDTKTTDIQIADDIMEHYAKQYKTDTLTLFEWVLSEQDKRMDYQLADWVHSLADRFHEMYGETQGEFVTRQIISHYIVQDETVH